MYYLMTAAATKKFRLTKKNVLLLILEMILVLIVVQD